MLMFTRPAGFALPAVYTVVFTSFFSNARYKKGEVFLKPADKSVI